MGRVEKQFAQFTSETGTEFRIEKNKTGRFDIHIDRFQLVFNEETFTEFVDLVTEAEEELRAYKDLNQQDKNGE